MKPKVIAFVGPTASGKTGLSIEFCLKYGGEVVSADSMQIYRHMRIATAKPSEEEMRGVKHHLIDFLEPTEAYSVGKYVSDARRAIADIASRGKIPVICGGTGLYVDSLISGVDFVDNSSDDRLREELTALANEKGIDYLLGMLKTFDPDSAERLTEQKNLKRTVRAIEFYKTTGITITQQNIRSKQNSDELDCVVFLLTAHDRQYIYDRINLRVDLMLENGLLDEAREILSLGLSDTAKTAIGYKQLKPYLEGEAPLEECVGRLKKETRNYAKRQLTWFRRNENAVPIYIDELKTTEEQLEFVSDYLNNRGIIYG